MKLTPTIQRGFVFGGVCATFGAAAWAIIAFFNLKSSEIPVLSSVGFLFWGGVGFLIGVFSPSPRSGTTAIPCPDDGKLQRTVLGTIGRFVYLTIVGGLAGFLVAGLLELTMIVLALATHGDVVAALDATHDSPFGFVILCGLNAAVMGAQVSGILFAWIWAVDEIGTAVMGSACGALSGSIGGLIPLTFTTGIASFYAALLGGVLGGALAAGLAGVLLLRRPRVKSTPPSVNPTEELRPSARHD